MQGARCCGAQHGQDATLPALWAADDPDKGAVLVPEHHRALTRQFLELWAWQVRGRILALYGYA
jgi:hypothetical protein